MNKTFKKSKKVKSELNKFLFECIIPIFLALILALLIMKFVLFKTTVPTESMSPTVEKNEQFFVKRIYNPTHIKRGDIVVFNSGDTSLLLMKRIIGMPDDKIEIKDGGKVFINGEEFKEDYVKNPSDKGGSFIVPSGRYLMLGDNRANSDDSRSWNNPYIDGNDIKGKVIFRIAPFNKIGFMN